MLCLAGLPPPPQTRADQRWPLWVIRSGSVLDCIALNVPFCTHWVFNNWDMVFNCLVKRHWVFHVSLSYILVHSDCTISIMCYFLWKSDGYLIDFSDKRSCTFVLRASYTALNSECLAGTDIITHSVSLKQTLNEQLPAVLHWKRCNNRLWGLTHDPRRKRRRKALRCCKNQMAEAAGGKCWVLWLT